MLLSWLLVSSMNTMDTETLKECILDAIQDIPVSLRWKMINLGTQDQAKWKEQVCTLHIYVNELDVTIDKPLLMALYESKPSADHVFPLKVRMQLVSEISLVLNTKGRKNVDKLGVPKHLEHGKLNIV